MLGVLRRLVGRSAKAADAPDEQEASGKESTSDNQYKAGNDQIRTLALWLAGAFAAVAAVMLAGTQLSSIGRLDPRLDTGRFMVAAVSAALAIILVGGAIWALMRIQMPSTTSAATVRRSAWLRSHLDRVAGHDRGFVQGAADVGAFLDEWDRRRRPVWRANLGGRPPDPADLEQVSALAPHVRSLLQYADHLVFQRRLVVMGALASVFATLAAGCLVAFAWAANPAPSGTLEIPATPVRGLASVPEDERAELAGDLGAGCVSARGQVRVLVLAEVEGGLEVVTADPGCAPRRWVLPAADVVREP